MLCCVNFKVLRNSESLLLEINNLLVLYHRSFTHLASGKERSLQVFGYI